MATTINAATTGLIETSDGTAVLDLQTGGTTALRVNASQAIGVGSTPAFGTTGQFLTSQGNAASPTWTTGGTGTVTSVGWTGGIVTVATATTTPAFTIAGTSGGIVYFNSASTWASSAALTQYGVVYGGGAGAAPDATAAGTTGQFLGANTGAAPTWKSVSATPAGSNGQFQYNNSSAFGGASNFTYNATGPIVATTIGVGAATPSASGSGITFPATQSASTDANTLDDYEEGTWTPTLGGTATYSIASGRYTRVGNSVFIQGIMTVTSIGTGSTSTISGLPFAGQSAQRICLGGVAYWGNFAASTITVIPWIDNGVTTVQFAGNASSAASLGFLSPFQNGTFVQFSGCYITNV
jgi:hypothetical protein